MKRFIQNNRMRLHENWDNLMHSTQKKMSTGAQQLTKIITVAHKDQWFRNNHKNK